MEEYRRRRLSLSEGHPIVWNLGFGICNFPRRGLILVLLEEPLQPYGVPNLPMESWFQSLFYWKNHFNGEKVMLTGTGNNCFNPCFTGRTTSTLCCHSRSGRASQVSILVLLEEPLQLILIVEFKLHTLGFNPCFTGRTTSTGPDSRKREGAMVFQSLFYWKNHFNSTFYLKIAIITLLPNFCNP
jgi:hypothetical protein